MGDDVMLLDAHPASSQRSERDGIWIAAPGRAVTMVEAATGDPRWELKLDDGETRFELFDMGNEPWILASSYEGAGDNRPPRLRRIDPVSGLVIWSVEGRPGAVWALDGVAFDDTTLFTVDVFDDPQSAVSPSGSVVHAFSLDRGRSMFAVDIEAPQGAFTTRRLMHMLTKGPDMALLASTAHGLLVRLDPRTGEQFWSTRINPGKPDHLVQSIDGNLAVYVTTSLNDFLYDLETGHRLVDSTYR
jgi:outer membrane protein assembly factor BamB